MELAGRNRLKPRLNRTDTKEGQLRAALLHAPAAERQGRWTRVEVTQVLQEVFDPTLLPDEVRQDPRYRRATTEEVIACLPLPQAPRQPRPGWPIRREVAPAR